MKVTVMLLCLLLWVGKSFSQEDACAYPKLYVAGKCASGELKLSDINRSGGIFVLTKDGEKPEVHSFQLNLVSGSKNTSCSNEGYMYTDKCKSLISTSKVGDVIQINNVEFKEKQVSVGKITALEFTLID